MKRTDQVYLKDILESIEMILSYTEHKTEFGFLNDIMLQDAVIRRFEIIGEASAQISTAFKADAPQIQWRLMKEMRNKLAHEYFGVSVVTVYSTIKQDLPLLKQQIDDLVK